MKTSILIFSILICNTCFVQNSLHLNGSVGISRVYKIPKPINYPVAYSPQFSATIGVNYNHVFKDGLFINTGIELNQINGCQKESPQLISQNKFDRTQAYIQDNYYLSYLNAPFQIGWHFERLGISSGVRVGYLLHSAIHYYKKGNIIGGESAPLAPKMVNSNFDKFDFGISSKLNFILNSKIDLEARFYYNFRDIYPDITTYEARLQQLSVGVNYKFVNW